MWEPKMSVRSKTTLKIVQPEIEQMETVIQEAAKQAAPMVQRLASHRDRIDLALKELESERFELISRRDLLRRQVEAVEQGLAMLKGNERQAYALAYILVDAGLLLRPL